MRVLLTQCGRRIVHGFAYEKRRCVNKFLAISVLVGSSCLGGAAHAQLSGSIAVMSLYKTRGIDQDNRNRDAAPALQASLRYDWSNGLYVGNWSSTGRFGRGRLETDWFGGYVGKLSDDLSYDVGYVQYYYPNEHTWNSGAVYGGVSYQGANLYVYWGTREDVNRDDIYVHFTYKRPITERLHWTLGLGHMAYGPYGYRDKWDASIGLEYLLQEKLVLSLQVQGANRRSDVSHGERNTRVIAGLRMDF